MVAEINALPRLQRVTEALSSAAAARSGASAGSEFRIALVLPPIPAGVICARPCHPGPRD